MKRKKWVRLDNASNIFLAAMTDRDTKVFRLSAALVDAIDPVLLQTALDKTYERYVLYHSVLRRGFFWYYLENSNLKPVVMPDTQPPCTALYHFDRKELLFRVVYHYNRIHLEVFHALSDGTGALWFFEDLLNEYVMLRYPDNFKGLDERERDKLKQQSEDSFAHYFRKGKQKFSEEAQSAIRTLTKAGKMAITYGGKVTRYLDPFPLTERQKERVYQVRGKKTPDNRPHVIEMEMPVKAVLQLAREQQTTLTLYLTAVFIEATHRTNTHPEKGRTIAVSVPINLRQFYPSHSARNFFSTARLEYTYDKAASESLETICRTLKEQFQMQITRESLDNKLKRLIAFEYNPFTRIIIRPIKDFILKLVNLFNNRNLTVAISNLGRVSLPEPIDGYVQQLYLQTSAVRPQFCAVSHGDDLTVCFTSPFVDTEIQEQFARILTEAGVPVTVAVNKVTSAELGGSDHETL